MLILPNYTTHQCDFFFSYDMLFYCMHNKTEISTHGKNVKRSSQQEGVSAGECRQVVWHFAGQSTG